MADSNGSGQPVPASSQGTALVKNQGVSLGCGSLILIALIVLIFSDRRDNDVKRDVRALRTEVAELKKSVDAQAAEIKALRQKIEEARVGSGR